MECALKEILLKVQLNRQQSEKQQSVKVEKQWKSVSFLLKPFGNIQNQSEFLLTDTLRSIKVLIEFILIA